MELIFKLHFPLRATLVIVLLLLNVATASADQLSSKSDRELSTGKDRAEITKAPSNSAEPKGIASCAMHNNYNSFVAVHGQMLLGPDICLLNNQRKTI